LSHDFGCPDPALLVRHASDTRVLVKLKPIRTPRVQSRRSEHVASPQHPQLRRRYRVADLWTFALWGLILSYLSLFGWLAVIIIGLVIATPLFLFAWL
jgi:hypothetical protein